MDKRTKEAIANLLPIRTLKFINKTRNRLIGLKHRGDRVYCVICQSKFDEFKTFGLDNRKNALCYHCSSLERHRMIYKYLDEKTIMFKRNVKLLHFAPEKIFFEIFASRPNIEYVPVDLVPERYSYSDEIKVSKADITKIPYDDSSFDVILCNHVLEHIPDDRLAMSELFRVLKPGGFGIFQVPLDYNREKTYEDFTITDPKEREKAFGQYDHVRWYGRDYKDRLASVGFNVLEDDYPGSFSDEDRFKFGFRSDEMVYYCTKNE